MLFRVSFFLCLNFTSYGFVLDLGGPVWFGVLRACPHTLEIRHFRHLMKFKKSCVPSRDVQ